MQTFKISVDTPKKPCYNKTIEIKEVITMKKYEIYMVDLGENVGSEQNGYRPCVILQNDKGNRFSTTTIVAPITKQTKRFTTTHLDIEGLREPSKILFEQIRVVDMQRVKKYLMTLPQEIHPKVDNMIKLSFGL